MLRSAALASSAVASTPSVPPRSSPSFASTSRTNWNTRRWVSTDISRRVRDKLEWSGVASVSSYPRNARKAMESATRHAIPRSESMPSKKPTKSALKYTTGGMLGRPVPSE